MTEFEYPPSVTDPANSSYKNREWRSPTVDADETVIFDEPGRILPGDGKTIRAVNCLSHYFLVTKPKFGQYRLKVKHAGGEEGFEVGYDDRLIRSLGQLDSDSRYDLLQSLLNAYHHGQTEARIATTRKYEKAFTEGRLKKRKFPRKPQYKVWIDLS